MGAPVHELSIFCGDILSLPPYEANWTPALCPCLDVTEEERTWQAVDSWGQSDGTRETVKGSIWTHVQQRGDDSPRHGSDRRVPDSQAAADGAIMNALNNTDGMTLFQLSRELATAEQAVVELWGELWETLQEWFAEGREVILAIQMTSSMIEARGDESYTGWAHAALQTFWPGLEHIAPTNTRSPTVFSTWATQMERLLWDRYADGAGRREASIEGNGVEDEVSLVTTPRGDDVPEARDLTAGSAGGSPSRPRGGQVREPEGFAAEEWMSTVHKTYLRLRGQGRGGEAREALKQRLGTLPSEFRETAMNTLDGILRVTPVDLENIRAEAEGPETAVDAWVDEVVQGWARLRGLECAPLPRPPATSMPGVSAPRGPPPPVPMTGSMSSSPAGTENAGDDFLRSGSSSSSPRASRSRTPDARRGPDQDQEPKFTSCCWVVEGGAVENRACTTTGHGETGHS